MKACTCGHTEAQHALTTDDCNLCGCPEFQDVDNAERRDEADIPA